jgi:FkbM family methyltransferase
MEKLGTKYGGWFIPKECKLDENSIVYSVGVGEDISFDIKIQTKYNSNIVLLDPTKRAIKHFEECKQYFKNNKKYKFTGDIQSDYYKNLITEEPDFDKIKYVEIGLWDKPDRLKFYKQSNKNNVSQSVINDMFTGDYDIIEVDSLKNIMQTLNHTNIDLLKLDIEGAEISVLNQMLNDNIFPKYLCIEFDLFLKKKDKNNDTRKLINRLLQNNYIILINDDMNITFTRNI